MATIQDQYHTIVIGAGAAGLLVAKGLAAAGKKVLLVEKGPYGGDCANFGCIPSKSLVASANMAHELWRAGLYGIEMSINYFHANKALERVRDIVAEVREKNNPDALQKIGLDTFSGTCTFIDANTVQVEVGHGEARQFSAQNIVVATGSYPVIPDIKGLQEVPYHTNYSIFNLEAIPTSLAIIGGGQIGCEFAQAFRRLGSSVVVVEKQDYLLGTEEPEAYRTVQSALVKEGVEIYLGTEVNKVRREGDKISLDLYHKADEKERELFVNQLLFTTGRKPNIAHLKLEAAGVEFGPEGIPIDAYGRTNIDTIWAVGDATGHSFYTHAAENQARTVLYNLLSLHFLRRKMDVNQPIPRVSFTDPEVASIGLTEKEAIEQYGPRAIAIYFVPLSEADRAICQGKSEGFVKVVTKRYSSKILGATCVAPIAADMLLEIACAMRYKVPLRRLSSLIHPYPTYSQIIQKAADKWLTETILPLFGKLLHKFK